MAESISLPSNHAGRNDRTVAIIMAIVYTMLSIALRTGQHSFDAFMFTAAIHQGEFLPTVFRPHNLLYLPIAMVTHLGLRTAGFATSAYFSGQLISAIFGGVSVAMVWLVLRRLVDRQGARLLTVFFASTHAVSAMSQWVEVYTVSLALVALTYWAAIRRTPSGWAVGLFAGASILGHLTNALLAFPIIIGSLLFSRRFGFMTLLKAGLIGTALAGVVYTIVAALAGDARSPTEVLRWIVSWTATTTDYGIWSPKQLALGGLGFKRALVDGRAGILMLPHVILFGLATLVLWQSRGLSRRLAFVVLSHASLYALFFSWWEPLNVEFWVVTMLPVTLLLALAWRETRTRTIRMPFAALLMACCLVQVGMNGYRAVVYTDESGDQWRSSAARIAAELKPQDLLIIHSDPLHFIMPMEHQHFFVIGMEQHFDLRRGDASPAFALLRRMAADCHAAGGTVYLSGTASHPAANRLELIGLDQDGWMAMLREATGAPLDTPLLDGLLIR